MSIEKLNHGAVVQEYKVLLPFSRISDSIQQELLKIQKTVKRPGYRPGKVPMKKIEEEFTNSITLDVVEKLTKENIKQIVVDNNINAINHNVNFISGVENGKIDGDVEFVVKFEVFPTIELPDFSKLTLEKIKVTIGDEQFEDEKKKLLEAYKDFDTDSKSAAKKGSKLIVDYELNVEDSDHHEKQENFAFILGNKEVFPAFEEHFNGATKGQELEFVVVMPTEYPNIGGKNGTFKVKIQAIKKATLPKFDDELAAKMKFASKEELEKAIHEKLQKDIDGQITIINKVKLFDQLESLLTFDVPESFYQKEYDALKAQMASAAKSGNMPAKSYSDESIDKITHRRIRVGMMLDHYGELNAVKLTQDDLNQALYNKLAEYPLEMHQQVVDFYSKNKDANKSLFSAALENKIVNDILSKVDLVDKEYNFNDFEKLIESIAEKIK